MHISELDTPVMLVDLTVLEDNIRRLQMELTAAGINGRPHIKTHKIPAFGRKQIEAGAIGICCQKVGEAEVFAMAGFDNILIAFNIVGRPKVERLARLQHLQLVGLEGDRRVLHLDAVDFGRVGGARGDF